MWEDAAGQMAAHPPDLTHRETHLDRQDAWMTPRDTKIVGPHRNYSNYAANYQLRDVNYYLRDANILARHRNHRVRHPTYVAPPAEHKDRSGHHHTDDGRQISPL
jgi:hypothetical protein